MSTLRLIGRAVTAAGAAALLTVGLAGCGAGSLDKNEVQTTIKTELDKQITGAGAVTCPTDLKAEVGQSVRCEFEVGGQPVDVVATVTSIQGGTANYNIATEARPVAKDLLARKVGEQVASTAGVTVDSTECSGDLQPKVGESVTCTVTGEGQTGDFTVTVTKIDGGLINYSLEAA